MGVYQDESYQPNLIAATASCCTLSIVAVVLRFVARRIGNVSLGKDDYAIIPAVFFSVAYSAVQCSMIAFGLGLHYDQFNPEWALPLGNGSQAALCILPFATVFVKISVLFLYMRIFPTENFKRVCYVVGAVCVGYGIASFLTTLLECRPIGTSVNHAEYQTCINIDLYFDIIAFINAALDFVILGLPMPMIWKLQMSTRRKLQTAGIFLLGCFACVASLIRAAYTLKNSEIDPTYNDAWTAIWVIVEVNIGTICACLPNFNPMLRRLANNGVSNVLHPYQLAEMASSVISRIRSNKSRGSNSDLEADHCGPDGVFVELKPQSPPKNANLHRHPDSEDGESNHSSIRIQ